MAIIQVKLVDGKDYTVAFPNKALKHIEEVGGVRVFEEDGEQQTELKENTIAYYGLKFGAGFAGEDFDIDPKRIQFMLTTEASLRIQKLYMEEMIAAFDFISKNAPEALEDKDEGK